MNLLDARNVSKHYGGAAALRSACFELKPGEVHVLMGENGAGKSTLARILAGSERADQAEIRLNGEELAFGSSLDAQRAGIAIIYQELDLFPHLNVGENIVIGNLGFRDGRLTSSKAIEAFVRPYLDQVGLSIPSAARICDLSIGDQQRIAIARALSMDCRILLMDEPTSALGDDAAEILFGVMADLKAKGVAIVYVSHKIDEIFRLCDRITVLRDGETIGTRIIAEAERAEIIRMMVDRPVSGQGVGSRQVPQGRILFTARQLRTHKLRDLSFDIGAGEVLGIAGLVGAGRSELGRAIVGLDPILGGAMMLDGRDYRPAGPADAQEKGACLLPEDRKLQGLMLGMSITENATLPTLASVSRGGFVDKQAEQSCLAPLARRLALKSRSLDMKVRELSGGNQQKVLLARSLLIDPDLFFLDDPARGIDIGAKEDIYQIIAELKEAGKAVLLASSELSELMRCSDRILVLNEGRLAGLFAADAVTQDQIMAAAAGSLAEAVAA